MRQETLQFWYLVRLVLEVLRYFFLSRLMRSKWTNQWATKKIFFYVSYYAWTCYLIFNSLVCDDAIWYHGTCPSWVLVMACYLMALNHYTLCTTKLLRGEGVLVSLRLSVRPSICLASRVCSIVSTVLFGSISCLYILSSNFRRCVTCKVSCKISKVEFLAIFYNL